VSDLGNGTQMSERVSDTDNLPSSEIHRSASAPAGVKRFQIYLKRDDGDKQSVRPELRETSDVAKSGMQRIFQAGASDGHEVREIIDIPGFNLTRAWFKTGFPLPLHAHEADCLYYIAAGDLKLGTETLGAGDSFFVPGGTPYKFVPGENGVEIVEFRHSGAHDIKILAPRQTYWDAALEKVTALRSIWKSALRPTG